MADLRPRVACTKPINLVQLAGEVGVALAASAVEVVVAAASSPVTQARLAEAIDAHIPRPAPPAPRYSTITAFTTGNSGEQVASLPVGPASPRVVFAVAVPDVRAGDLLVVLAEVQATNDLGYNCLFTSQLLLTTGPAVTTGIEVSEANGTNITPAMHHHAMAKVGTYMADTDLGDRHVVLACRADASLAKAGDLLTVDADYGRLSVLRIRQPAQ